MLKYLLTALFFSATSFGFSQTSRIAASSGLTYGTLPVQLPQTNIGNIGEPFLGQRVNYADERGSIEGSPLLFDDWKTGMVILKNNERYQLEKINLDASKDKFIFRRNDTTYEFFDNVQEIRIYDETDTTMDMVFRTDINPEAANFVQVFAKGKIAIFQEYEKKPEGENYTNGIVTTTRKFVLHTQLNAVKDNKLIPMKFAEASLDELTADKKTQVDAYVKENRLKTKKQGDFLKAIRYYNSISTSLN
jgi:hypothetical protein